MKQTSLIVLGIATLALVSLANPVVEAYIASSTNYRIQSDSINFGGGLSTSSSFKLEDTLGEIATGQSTSTVPLNIHAGYQAMQEIYLAISVPSDVTMTPTIDQIKGGSASGTAAWIVTTDSPAGYTLSLKASTNPALARSDDSFANYTPDNGLADFTWSVGLTASEFGMSPQGSDVVDRFKDNGADCGVGSLETERSCWGPITTTNTTVASSGDGTHPNGTETEVVFRAGVGETKATTQTPGHYSAEITATALAL